MQQSRHIPLGESHLQTAPARYIIGSNKRQYMLYPLPHTPLYLHSADVPTISPTPPTPTPSPSPSSTVECSYDGAISFPDTARGYDMNGNYYVEGNIEICRNGVYTPVCSNGWDTADATTACRQLGFFTTYGELIYYATNFCSKA